MATDKIQRALNIMIVATVLLWLVFGAAFAYLFVANQDRVGEGQRAHDAVCLLRADLQTRVTTGNQFLRDHPEGALGISASDLQRSLDNQQATIDALSEAGC